MADKDFRPFERGGLLASFRRVKRVPQDVLDAQIEQVVKLSDEEVASATPGAWWGYAPGEPGEYRQEFNDGEIE